MAKRNGAKGLRLIMILFLMLGIGSFIYYSVIVIYAGFYTAFSWFWLLAGMGSLFLSTVLYFVMEKKITIPRFISIPVSFLFITGCLIFIIIEGMIVVKGNQKAMPNGDYMIVLGAQINGSKITKSLEKRLEIAVIYLRRNVNTKVIVSGGQGKFEDIAESTAMKEYLINHGIKKERIMEENKSKNTKENIEFSKKLIKGDSNRVIIVTNRFHIYRGMSIGRKEKIGMVEGLGSEVDPILCINYYVREAFAVVKDILAGNMLF